MSKYNARHYYNAISYTPYPFYISFSVLLFVIALILFVNQYEIISLNIVYGIVSILCFFILKWFEEMAVESSFLGKYTRKLTAAIVFGFILFLCSEIMLFAGFFWAFFDRIFNISYATYGLSQPLGVDRILWYKAPLKATLVLLTSGYLCNHGYYLLRIGSWYTMMLYSNATIALAYAFTYIQYTEYCELMFTISDSVYCSLFFILTGFHGMHVIIGTIFIHIQHERIWKHHLPFNRCAGYGLALTYWHFVDIIWLFLFIFVYFFNNYYVIHTVFDKDYIYFVFN